MKPVLIVDGKELEVVNINYRQGVIQYVQAETDDNVYEFFSNKEYIFSKDADHVIDLDKCLKFVGQHDDLINQLDELIQQESDELTSIAVEAFEIKDNQPFNTNLTDAHKEYHAKRERLMGVVDAVEEVKAFTEGFYNDENR